MNKFLIRDGINKWACEFEEIDNLIVDPGGVGYYYLIRAE